MSRTMHIVVQFSLLVIWALILRNIPSIPPGNHGLADIIEISLFHFYVIALALKTLECEAAKPAKAPAKH